MKQQACGRNERMSPSSARRDAECVAGCLFSRSLDRRGHPVDSMSVRGRSRGALTSAKKRTGLSLPSSPKRASTRFSSDKTAVARLRLFSHVGWYTRFTGSPAPASTASISQVSPTVREYPRWSKALQASACPTSTAALPGGRRWVGVGPPLSWSVPSNRLRASRPAPKPQVPSLGSLGTTAAPAHRRPPGPVTA